MENQSEALTQQNILLLTVPETDFSIQMNTAIRLYEKHPEIKSSIIADQDRHAKQKKAIREKDKLWLRSRQPSLIETTASEIDANELALNTGRPRMNPLVAYTFLWARGALGGPKNSEVQSALNESTTLNIFLMNQGIRMPGASTVVEQLNAISAETRALIHQAQLQQSLEDDLDDFNNYAIDSTASKGNSEHPVESKLMTCLVARIFHLGCCLEKFGIKNMHERNFPYTIEQMKAISKKVAFDTGKKGSQGRRKSFYRKLISKSTSAKKKFELEMLKIDAQVEAVDMLPSRKEQLLFLIAHIKNDMEKLQTVIDCSTRRVLQQETVKSTEKVLSLSDVDVACIVKGGREAVFGFKPQLGRSENGFVTSLIVPEGNASDSGQLDAMIEQHISNTKVQPKVISADDGYANGSVRDKWLTNDVEVFSISGSKGKRLTPEEDWDSDPYREARNNRSAVESLMFCIKFTFNFGLNMRRGINNVRDEMMEKVLAYNFARMVKIRRRKLLAA